MSVNTFVWGFTSERAAIIDKLSDEGVISKKCWISLLWHRNDRLLEKKQILKESTFHSNRWLEKYGDLVAKYQEGVEFNQEVYSKVYEKLYLFVDMYSRHDHRLHEKSLHHYINQFNMLYNFFYSVLVKEQVQLVLFDCIPHLGPELILYEIAKAMNIRTLMVYPSPIPNKYFYLENPEDYGDFRFMTRQEEPSSYVKLEKKFFIDHFYMRNVKRFRFSIFEAVLRSFMRPHRLFEEFAFNIQRYWRVKRYRRNLSKLVKPVDYGKKYVYFPLHLQPELTTSALGGVFNDQVLALEVLSKKIPKDWVIYVKENPKQTDFMRDDAFFERLKLIDNLRIAPLDENTFKLIEYSQFVATITGTAGWEAICGGKPALVFGKTWYHNFEGVFKWHSDINVDEITHYQVDHAKLERDYNELISKAATGVVDNEYSCLVQDYDDEKNVQLVAEFLSKLIRESGEKVVFPHEPFIRAA